MVEPEFKKFLQESVEPIQGWLHQEAALLTAHLAGVQKELQIGGPVLEIGLFRGKYLSVLYKLSQPGELVLGIDLYIGAADVDAAANLTRANVANACGDAERLRILAADSFKLTTDDLRQETSDKFRLASIDGGHTRELVCHDLEIAYPLLKQGCILALDDAFNHTTPGVNEGIFEFFFRFRPKLAPFAHCYNKLFVTTPDFHERYLQATNDFLDEVTWLPTHDRTTQRRNQNRSIGFAPMMFGYEIVPFL